MHATHARFENTQTSALFWSSVTILLTSIAENIQL